MTYEIYDFQMTFKPLFREKERERESIATFEEMRKRNSWLSLKSLSHLLLFYFAERKLSDVLLYLLDNMSGFAGNLIPWLATPIHYDTLVKIVLKVSSVNNRLATFESLSLLNG